MHVQLRDLLNSADEVFTASRKADMGLAVCRQARLRGEPSHGEVCSTLSEHEPQRANLAALLCAPQ